MNKIRRKQIDEAKTLINKGLDIIQDVLSEEDFAFNNLSEGLQQTMRGESMESNVDELEECVDHINEALECLDNIE